jgi:hypothetical protein
VSRLGDRREPNWLPARRKPQRDTVDEIKGIARVKFHHGKVEEWKRLTEEALEIVRTKDRGTLQ